jgi:hypothetical protein
VGLVEVAPRPHLFLQALPVELKTEIRNPKSKINRGVAPTALLFVVDASFYHSFAPTALLFVVDVLFYHIFAPMALLFVVDVLFYHSFAPTALLFVVDVLFYHSFAPMALTPRLAPRSDVSRFCGRSKVRRCVKGCRAYGAFVCG